MEATEIAFVIAGYALALRRLLGASKTLLWILPDKFQPWVAGLLVVIPELLTQLQGVGTKIDLAETLVMAVGAFFTAVHRKEPPKGGTGEPVHVHLKTPTTLALMAFVLLGCSGAQEPPACNPQELAKLDAAFLTEATVACKLEGGDYDTCKALPALREKYARLRQEWIECH